MARLKFTDKSIAATVYAGIGNPEVVIPDPLLHRHRVTITATRKRFEIQAERPKKFGPRRTYVRTVGIAPMMSVAEAREKATAMLARIDAGKDPAGYENTLGEAWERLRAQNDLKPRTLKIYAGSYGRCLSHWAGTSLKTLSDNPVMSEELHTKLTKERGPIQANHALQLLRIIYRSQAKRDRTLVLGHHPCTSVKWNPEKPADAAIPSALMLAWRAQLEKLRARNPLRAGFHILCLRTGCRPGELSRAKWSDIERGVLVLPETKTHLVEVPLCPQIYAELGRMRNLRPASPYIFATRNDSHLTRLTEAKAILSHSGNSGRHTHHTIGVTIGIDDRVLDVLEGRTLLKSGMAGRGYIDRGELGPNVRDAQRRINDRIDEFFQTEGTKIEGLPPTGDRPSTP